MLIENKKINSFLDGVIRVITIISCAILLIQWFSTIMGVELLLLKIIDAIALIAFLFYAFYLHIRSFLGWKMTRAAWLAVLGLVILIVSYWGVSVFSPSVHPGP